MRRTGWLWLALLAPSLSHCGDSGSGGSGATSGASGSAGASGSGGSSASGGSAGAGGQAGDAGQAGSSGGSAGAGGNCLTCSDGAQGNSGEFCPGSEAKLEALLACACGDTASPGACATACVGPCKNFGAASQECLTCTETLCGPELTACKADG